MSLFFLCENEMMTLENAAMVIRKKYMLLYEIILRRDRDDQRN